MARNRLLAFAARVGVVAAAALLAGRAVDLSNVLSSAYPAHSISYSRPYSFLPGYEYFSDAPYLESYAALNLVGAIFMAVGFGAAARAFLQASEAPKRRLLGLSAGSFALYGAMILPIPLMSTVDVGESLRASFAFAAGSAFAIVVAGTLIRAAAASGVPSRRAAREITTIVLSAVHARLLAWGSVGLALYFALRAASDALDLGWLPDVVGRLPGSLTAGVVTAAAGEAVAALGAATAAWAFFGRAARRDGMLRVAAIGIGLGLLIAGAGLILEALYFHDTAIGLDAASSLVLAVAAGCVAAAFLRSSEQRDGPDLAVLADPA
ncbi:MAG: hypothetical protein QOG85_2011 [Gaiellaceae bacterium]|jgi:hypothetical protein|nr:hypothetical protein [Gaiellaceae bacterium]